MKDKWHINSMVTKHRCLVLSIRQRNGKRSLRVGSAATSLKTSESKYHRGGAD